MSDLLTYCLVIVSFFWHIIKSVFTFISAVPVGILHKFPFGNYFLLYVFTVIPVAVWLLMKIPAVFNFMRNHQDAFFLTKHFNFGVVTSVFIHKDGLHLFGNLLVVIPVSIWCGHLMTDSGYLDVKKISFILQFNMIAKWFVVVLRNHRKRSDGHEMSTGMSGEIYCMLFTALAVCAKTWDNDFMTSLIYIFFAVVLIISFATEFGRDSKVDGGVHMVSIINGIMLGSILPVL